MVHQLHARGCCRDDRKLARIPARTQKAILRQIKRTVTSLRACRAKAGGAPILKEVDAAVSAEASNEVQQDDENGRNGKIPTACTALDCHSVLHDWMMHTDVLTGCHRYRPRTCAFQSEAEPRLSTLTRSGQNTAHTAVRGQPGCRLRRARGGKRGRRAVGAGRAHMGRSEARRAK